MLHLPPTYIPLYLILTNLPTYPQIGHPLWMAPCELVTLQRFITLMTLDPISMQHSQNKTVYNFKTTLQACTKVISPRKYQGPG